MLIVADENMPLLDEFFGALGTIRRLPGRSMRPADLRGADLLLVRSVTQVGPALLAESAPRFVGSATIGTDHIDLEYLARRHIDFSAAPGCNAVAVGEYVATVLALFGEEAGCDLAGLRLAVVGCGNVGRAVIPRAQSLGLDVRVCDPFVSAASLPPGVGAMALDDLLAWADVVTLHVPLTRDGPAPTCHLLDAGRLGRNAWRLLINTSRGPVIDNDALADCLGQSPRMRVVLDVWEREPAVPPALLAKVWLGTPHVAGYSVEGKWRGTEQVYRAACRSLGIASTVTLASILGARGDQPVALPATASLATTLAACCDVRGDDARLRAVVVNDPAATAAAFDRLRREHPERREFGHYRVQAPKETPRATLRSLAALGFGLDD